MEYFNEKAGGEIASLLKEMV